MTRTNKIAHMAIRIPSCRRVSFSAHKDVHTYMDTTRSIRARVLNTRMRLNMQATGCVSAVHSFPSSVKRWNEVDTRHGIKGTQFFNGVIKLEPQKQSYEINQSKIIRRCSYAASSPAPAQASSPSRTQRIMEKISMGSEVGGAGGASSYESLKRVDQLWHNICTMKPDMSAPLDVVKCFQGSYLETGLNFKISRQFDVVICGGTLGIFFATALCLRGLRVGVIERTMLKGRAQEWNISRKEIMELVDTGILSEDEIEKVIAVAFNPNRCGFEGKGEVWVEDILNLGISPLRLIDLVKQRFMSLGGVVFEGHGVSSICTYDDAVDKCKNGGNVKERRLLHYQVYNAMLDALGSRIKNE